MAYVCSELLDVIPVLPIAIPPIGSHEAGVSDEKMEVWIKNCIRQNEDLP
jgi:hypothetical protein